MALRVAILGSGNIGTDLMVKLRRTPSLTLVAMVGIDPASDGLARARALGVPATDAGLERWLATDPDVDVVVEATSAAAHAEHAPLLAARGIRCIDLTPAALGPAVVPDVGLDRHLDAPDVSLVTCGAQATVPVVAALSAVGPVGYAEVVCTVASRSAGQGTRQNIDEFTVATARSLETLGGAAAGKAVIILNPAAPPITMRNTVTPSSARWTRPRRPRPCGPRPPGWPPTFPATGCAPNRWSTTACSRCSSRSKAPATTCRGTRAIWTS